MLLCFMCVKENKVCLIDMSIHLAVSLRVINYFLLNTARNLKFEMCHYLIIITTSGEINLREREINLRENKRFSGSLLEWENSSRGFIKTVYRWQ